jgi:hypothetical protein
VKELAGQATVAAQHAYGQARDQVPEAATVVAGSVEQQPLIALLIAGFVCGVVGFPWRDADFEAVAVRG